jgi:hypothetical protein
MSTESPGLGIQISRGHHVCISCHFESVLVAAHRCHRCDREVCTFCSVRIAATSEELCPECANEIDRDSSVSQARSALKRRRKT